MSRTWKKISMSVTFFVPFMITFFYNACARFGDSNTQVVSLSSSSVCSADLKKAFSTTFHPFLVNNCNKCHAAAHGSADLDISFQAFMIKGEALIKSKASDGHNSLSPTTINNQMNVFLPEFDAAYSIYQSCLQSAGNTDPSKQMAPLMTSAKMLATLSTTATQLVYDLTTDVDAGQDKPPVIFTITVKETLNIGTPVGLEFSNPRIKLRAGTTTPFEARGLHLYLDGVLQDNVTMYMNAYAFTNSTTDAPMVDTATAAALAFYPSISTSTKIAFKFDRLSSQILGGTSGSGQVVGSGGATLPANVTFTDLTNGGSLSMFSKYCTSCHSGATPSGGLNLTDYTAAKNAVSLIISRMNNSANPMPRSGLLGDYERGVVQVWSDKGTPQ